jgi:hypothetical protein
MLVYGRDGRIGPRLKHLFQGAFRNPEANRLTGIYEIMLKKTAIGSPGIIQLLHLHGQNISFCAPKRSATTSTESIGHLQHVCPW